MKRADAARLYRICERAMQVLAKAEPILLNDQKDPERERLFDAYADVVGIVLTKLLAPLQRQYPGLGARAPEGPPHNVLDAAGVEAVSRLTSQQIQSIDDALLAYCAGAWRKVAYVAMSVQQLGAELPELPLACYVQRVAALCAAGRLEARGNLDYADFSEVRLQGSGNPGIHCATPDDPAASRGGAASL